MQENNYAHELYTRQRCRFEHRKLIYSSVPEYFYGVRGPGSSSISGAQTYIVARYNLLDIIDCFFVNFHHWFFKEQPSGLPGPDRSTSRERALNSNRWSGEAD